MISPKRQRISLGEEDRISNLPDEIAIHILSSLETNQAIQSGTLSKRWKNLWCYVPSLSFDIRHVNTSGKTIALHLDEISSFIDRIFHSLPPSPSPHLGCLIRKFSLTVSNSQRFLYDDLLDCLNSVLRAGVRHLCLEYTPIFLKFQKLREVLTCETLVDLKLVERGGPAVFLQILYSLNLPNLKTLHLCVNLITPDESRKLFGCCPNLVSCTIMVPEFQPDSSGQVFIFEISAPKLKHLVLGLDAPAYARFVHNVVIEAPLLETLHISGILGYYSFHNSSSSSLVEAGLDLLQAKHKFELTGGCLLHILKEISGIKSLKIKRSLSNPLDHCIRHGSLNFPNLTRLELTGIHESLVLRLLGLTPNLEYLKLVQSDHGFEPVDEEPVDEEPVDEVSADTTPSCLLSRMKVIKVEEFHDWRSRLQLIKYLLKNGKVLEKMMIDCRRIVDYEDPNKSFENRLWDIVEISRLEYEMIKFLRGSRACKIEFLSPRL